MNDKRDEVIGDAIRKELDRHLVDANDTNTFADYRERAGFNKGLREAGNILSRCFSRGDFALSREAEIRRQIADELQGILLESRNDAQEWNREIRCVIEKLRGNK
jgi:predicted secreted protein